MLACFNIQHKRDKGPRPFAERHRRRTRQTSFQCFFWI